ncbi:DNA-directed RNA polymerase core subunit rpc40, partial [Coemansia sp. RSA 1694]
MFKCDLIKIIGNIGYKSAAAQDLVRELDGLSLVLDHMKIDDNHPFIKEHAVIALKGLLSNNRANQDFLRDVNVVDSIQDPKLAKAGIQAVITNDGQVSVKQAAPDKDRNRVVILEDRVENISGAEFPLSFDGQELSYSLEGLKNTLDIKIVRLTPTEIEFDLIGVDASIANAMRRILLAEIPTMAIETVYMINNTGVVQDEILAHRLGLVPIMADPEDFHWKRPGDPPTDQNTVVFKLD